MKLELNTTQAVELAQQQAESLAENSRIKVNSGPTFNSAKAQLIELKKVKKFITEKKESITKPLNEALKNTRELFKPVEVKIETIEKYLNGELLTYNRKLIDEQKKREAEAVKKVEEATAKGEEVKIDKIVKKVENVQEKIEQIKTRTIKKLRIIDKTKIPFDYLEPNEVKIKQALAQGVNIPGAELYDETIAVNSY